MFLGSFCHLETMISLPNCHQILVRFLARNDIGIRESGNQVFGRFLWVLSSFFFFGCKTMENIFVILLMTISQVSALMHPVVNAQLLHCNFRILEFQATNIFQLLPRDVRLNTVHPIAGILHTLASKKNSTVWAHPVIY